MKPVIQTWFMLLTVIAGTILATLSHTWGDSWPALLVRVAAPIPVGYCAGRLIALVITLSLRAQEGKG